MIHRLAHRLRWNHGSVETFWHEGTLMVSFRCNCGEVQDVTPALQHLFP